MGAEILSVAFNQSRHFNRDRIAGVGVIQRGHDFRLAQAGELRSRGDDGGIVISLPFSEAGASRILKQNGSNLPRLRGRSIPLAP